MTIRATFLDRRVPQGIIAFRVFGAGIKYLAAPRLALQDRAFFTLRAFDAGILRLFQGFDVLTAWIRATTDELTVTSGLDHQG